MNNLEWYGEVLQFCQLSKDCRSCPYSLLSKTVIQEESPIKPCFSSKETLLDLEAWLLTVHEGGEEDSYECADEDNQWLKDLLKVQFQDGIDDDDLFFEDEFL